MFQVSWKKLFWWKLVTKNAGSTPGQHSVKSIFVEHTRHLERQVAHILLHVVSKLLKSESGPILRKLQTDEIGDVSQSAIKKALRLEVRRIEAIRITSD